MLCVGGSSGSSSSGNSNSSSGSGAGSSRKPTGSYNPGLSSTCPRNSHLLHVDLPAGVAPPAAESGGQLQRHPAPGNLGQELIPAVGVGHQRAPVPPCDCSTRKNHARIRSAGLRHRGTDHINCHLWHIAAARDHARIRSAGSRHRDYGKHGSGFCRRCVARARQRSDRACARNHAHQISRFEAQRLTT